MTLNKKKKYSVRISEVRLYGHAVVMSTITELSMFYVLNIDPEYFWTHDIKVGKNARCAE